MKKSKLNVAKGVVWDLDNLYKGLDDPKIAEDRADIDTKSRNFEIQYRGKVSKGLLKPAELKDALVLYEDILTSVASYGAYAGLLQAKDSASDKINHFYQKAEEYSNTISNKLMFFELEILEIPEGSINTYLESSELINYKQFLIRILKFKSHTLQENEEIIINKKNQSGASAFIRLYDQISSELEFPLEIDNKVKNYNYSEITNILSGHKDRTLRESSAKSITNVYKKNARTFSFILNTLLHDKKITDEIRGYKFPQESTFLSDEVDAKTVEAMTDTIKSNYDLSEKFYKTKSKILGSELFEWDRYSVIYPEIEEPVYSYSEAKDLILNAFKEFSPVFHEIAKKFFDNNWIDAELSKGKKSGAFCAYTVPTKNPYILTNFTGKANDVRTLAHELGHAIHGYLSREQTLLNFWPVTPFAEIASIFCENLVFRKIFESTTDTKQKINLLGGRLQEIFATIFRQNAFYLYESEIHKLRREKGEQSVDDFSNNFQKFLQPMFGEGLTLSEGHKYWWIAIAHFYHYNFYVFSYAFGQSLSNALYGHYLEDGNDFTNRYIEVLKKGSSLELNELMKLLKVDIHKQSFWKEGLEPISDYIKEFEELTNLELNSKN
jgi:oligoendopeptidase F